MRVPTAISFFRKNLRSVLRMWQFFLQEGWWWALFGQGCLRLRRMQMRRRLHRRWLPLSGFEEELFCSKRRRRVLWKRRMRVRGVSLLPRWAGKKILWKILWGMYYLPRTKVGNRKVQSIIYFFSLIYVKRPTFVTAVEQNSKKCATFKKLLKIGNTKLPQNYLL